MATDTRPQEIDPTASDETFEKLLFDESSSDLTFLIDGHRIPAHRAVVLSSCELLRERFNSEPSINEARKVELLGMPLNGFKLLLTYFYTKKLSCHEQTRETLFELLRVVQLLELTDLETRVKSFLEKDLTLSTVFDYCREAESERSRELALAGEEFIIENATLVLESENFHLLPEATLVRILHHDMFCAEEIVIFHAVSRWCSKQARGSNLSNVLNAIRLDLIDNMTLMTTVKNSGLFSIESIRDAMSKKELRPMEVKFRGYLVPGHNLASSALGAKELRERCNQDIMMPQSCLNYGYRELPSTPIVRGKNGLIVKLSKPYFINRIEVDMPDAMHNLFDFSIQTSTSLDNWIELGSTRCRCLLSFKPRVVKYIRLILRQGTEVQLTALKVCFEKL